MNNSQIRILVAEDEEILKEILVTVLEDEDYQVDSAVNGEEAWDLINKNKYDLLASDLFMPKMNGIDLIIKCQEFFPNIKTILLSGGGKELEAIHGSNSVKYQGKILKIGAFIKKPYNLVELFSAIDDLFS